MKKLGIGLGALVLLLLVAAIVVPSFIPTDVYKDKITVAVRDATGRELTIGGDIGISLWPPVELEVQDVAFANAPGASPGHMASLKQLRIDVDVLSLLSDAVKIDSFVLVEPEIHLQIDKDGVANWTLVRAEQEAPAATGEAEPDEAPDQTAGGGLPENIFLGDVRLEGGRVTYSDARSGESQEISDVSMTIALPDLDSKLTAEGGLVWNGKAVKLSFTADSPRRLMTGETGKLELKTEAETLRLAYSGALTLDKAIHMVGALDLDVPSIRELAAWSGNPIAAGGSGLGPLKIKGQVIVDDKIFAFTDAQISLDAMNARGDFSADTRAAKPALKGRLEVDMLDLNPYLPPEAKGQAAKKSDKASKKAKAKAQEWSDEPIDLSALKLVNADFDLKVGGIHARDIKIGPSALSLALKDGLLVSDLTQLSLYDGLGKGRIVLDGRGAVPTLEQSFTIAGVAAEPLLTDAAGFDRLEGTGTFELKVKAKGRSQREMVEALNGQGVVTFVDGAIKGINLAAMARNLQSSFSAEATEEKTDFAELSGSFVIKKGILDNQDMKLLNPLLRIRGAGTADMPERTLDYRFEPKFVASLEGQGGEADSKGLAVPVIAKGPWHDLKYRPDLAGLVGDVATDPKKALKDLKKSFKGAKKSLKGDNKAASEGGEGEKAEELDLKKAGKAFKKLFGD